jgi:hypothetical protein
MLSSVPMYLNVTELPLHVLNSLLNLVNADMRGLSCKLLPFLLLEPHLQPALSSSCGTGVDFRLLRSSGGGLLGPPLRIAETEECAHLACLRMADVTVMHSVMTSATGSTAMVIGVCLVSIGMAAWGAKSILSLELVMMDDILVAMKNRDGVRTLFYGLNVGQMHQISCFQLGFCIVQAKRTRNGVADKRQPRSKC